MTENTNKQTEIAVQLKKLIQGYVLKQNGMELYNQHKEYFDKVNPEIVMQAFDLLMLEKPDIESTKEAANKVLNLLYKALNTFPHNVDNESILLKYLRKSNALLDEHLKSIRPLIKKLNSEQESMEEIADLYDKILNLRRIEKHYSVKENILFPVIEKHFPQFRCLQIMWSVHDDIRRNIKSLLILLESKKIPLAEVNQTIGQLFFDLYAIKFREEKIVFPVITKYIENKKLDVLLAEAFETGFAFQENSIEIVEYLKNEKISENKIENIGNMLDLTTGLLSAEQIKMIFNHLPVDITYIDENDEVKFFSTPPHRIFPRSTAIIGRKVQNCHPPESVETVNKIISAFKKGEKKMAQFWIKMKNQFIFIQYFAITDADNMYRGIIEVSQEISEIQLISGEKRLLDWE